MYRLGAMYVGVESSVIDIFCQCLAGTKFLASYFSCDSSDSS